MHTNLSFTNDKGEKLVIVCPDGNFARRLLEKVHQTRNTRTLYGGASKTVQIFREIESQGFDLDQVLEAFNSGDDKESMDIRNRANVKVSKVVTSDPGSVAGSYWEGS